MSDTTTTAPLRIFKTGATRIIEDETLRGKSVEEVRALLRSAYPEIANATVRETTTTEGQPVIEFLPVAGRKG
ncbi:MAG: hypothetical protein J0M33_29050 [Anaerolineae bacterium]|nr:hypothetical protein [Anaerolineae bacterium]